MELLPSKMLLVALIALAFTAPLAHASEFLKVQGRDFYYGSNKVFLSGTNLAWYSYGYDFGNGQYYSSSGPTLRSWVDKIAAVGGNSLRFWLHVEGDNTPKFDSNGYVTAPDRDGTVINELSQFLDYAASKDVFVIIVLWNGAANMKNNNFKNLIWDTSKLDSYINGALKPMVRALAGKPALAAWEIMNEPEGSVLIQGNSNPCYDTSKMGQYGAGWTGGTLPMQNLLRFINLQASAIRQTDPKALVTVGSWSEHPQSDAFSDTANYYKDSCLQGAGGKSDGRIDFYQMHTYSYNGAWNTNAPFKHTAWDFQLNKPLIIGEFAASCSQNEGIENLFNFAYNSGYNGIMSWQYNEGGDCSDSRATQDRGMQAVRYRTDKGTVRVDIH